MTFWRDKVKEDKNVQRRTFLRWLAVGFLATSLGPAIFFGCGEKRTVRRTIIISRSGTGNESGVPSPSSSTTAPTGSTYPSPAPVRQAITVFDALVRAYSGRIVLGRELWWSLPGQAIYFDGDFNLNVTVNGRLPLDAEGGNLPNLLVYSGDTIAVDFVERDERYVVEVR